MLKVILTRGLPASGKSTWAKEEVAKDPTNWKRVNRDSIRRMMDNYAKLNQDEKMLEQIRDNLILIFLQANKNVIVDDVNLSARHERHISQLVKDIATVEIKEFMDVPLGELLRRNAYRPEEERVPNHVIKKLAKQFYKNPEPPVYNSKLPFCVIVDIDGTLAHLGNRSPYDATNSYLDEVNLAVKKVILSLRNNLSIEKIFLITGRDEKFRSVTEKWLKDKEVPYDLLLMRKNDDRRKDYIYKKEMYENFIKDKYNVLFVMEDRNQVVNMYRKELNFTVFQVAEGDY